MFNLEYIASSLGVDIEQGGLSIMEEQVAASAVGALVPTKTPVTMNGSLLGWYKKPNEEYWTVGTFNGGSIAVQGASEGDIYCLKYFWQNENGQSIIIPVETVPDELHLVLINDLFNGDIATSSTETTRIGRLITDIPRFQSDGSQELSLTPNSAASVSLTGNALAIGSTTTCEDEQYYGTMTEELDGVVWQDNVIALAIENGDIDLTNEETENLAVRVLFKGNVASQLKDNSNFTFAVDSGTSATVTSDGVVTADETATGVTYISVALTGYANVDPAFVKVTVTA